MSFVALLSLSSLPDAPFTIARRPLSVLAFTGNDRHRFLHGLCTADVEALKPAGGTRDAAIVDAAGTMMDYLTVVDCHDYAGGSILALGEGTRADDLVAFFDKYIFPADDVVVADVTAQYCCFDVIGKKAGRFIYSLSAELPPPPLPAVGETLLIDEGTVVLGGSALGVADDGRPSFAVLLELDKERDGASAAAAFERDATGAGGVVAPSFETLRVRRGLSRHGSEYAAAHAPKASPLSLGLWDVVDADKGCYLGNEILARLAKAKRQKLELFGLHLDVGSSVPPVGAEVCADDGEAPASAGVVTSVALDEEGGASPFALVLVKPPLGAVGARVRIGDAARGALVDLPRAVRFRVSGGEEEEEEADEAAAKAAEAKAAEAKAAEAARKAAKLAAMEEKMRKLGLVKD